jgi:hypothetical protein
MRDGSPYFLASFESSSSHDSCKRVFHFFIDVPILPGLDRQPFAATPEQMLLRLRKQALIGVNEFDERAGRVHESIRVKADKVWM